MSTGTQYAPTGEGSVFSLHTFAQNYDWGKLGSSSKVAQLARTSNPAFVLEEDKPYAELWMGTHHVLPSRLEAGTSLLEHLSMYPKLLGKRQSRTNVDGGNDLPFLLKVLSIGKALSIQSHPNKAFAEKLHQEKPDVYRDPNHKPEMAIALTPFRALCGFAPLDQIASRLQDVITELKVALSNAESVDLEGFLNKPTKESLIGLFGKLMSAKKEQVAEGVKMMVNRYEMADTKDQGNEMAKIRSLVLELNNQFPDDVGIFCVFFLNLVELKPGEAIFLGAGEPHAYLSGDIIECMATSDNVLRAGLTPKARDVQNLLASLTWNPAPDTVHRVTPATFGDSQTKGVYTTLYDPPVSEFSVLLLALPQGRIETHRPLDGPSILIVTSGTGRLKILGMVKQLLTGSVVFIGAETEVTFEASEEEDLVLYRAFAE